MGGWVDLVPAAGLTPLYGLTLALIAGGVMMLGGKDEVGGDIPPPTLPPSTAAPSNEPSSSSSPSTWAPGSTSCRRMMLRRNVVLPQPEGPMNAVTERALTVMFTPCTARKSP